MSESLVIIRTFANLLDADDAQVELLTAGVYSLLFTDETAATSHDAFPTHSIALAVHNRDVGLAEAALTAKVPAV